MTDRAAEREVGITPQQGSSSLARGRDWGLPLFAAVVGGFMVAEGLTLPLLAQYSGLGAGFVVVFVGAVLCVLALVLAVQLLRGERFEPEAAEGADLDAPPSAKGFGLAAAGVLLPIVTIPWLGFTVGAGLAYACVTRAFGSTQFLRDVVVGLVLASIVWFCFTKLGVQLGAWFPLLSKWGS